MMNQSDQTFDENDSLITKDSSYRRKSQLYQQDINLLGRSFVSSGSYFQSLNNRKTSINNFTENPFNFNDNKNIHQPHTLHKETALITEDYDDSNVLNDTETFNNDTIDSQVDFSNRKNPCFLLSHQISRACTVLSLLVHPHPWRKKTSQVLLTTMTSRSSSHCLTVPGKQQSTFPLHSWVCC